MSGLFYGFTQENNFFASIYLVGISKSDSNSCITEILLFVCISSFSPLGNIISASKEMFALFFEI